MLVVKSTLPTLNANLRRSLAFGMVPRLSRGSARLFDRWRLLRGPRLTRLPRGLFD